MTAPRTLDYRPRLDPRNRAYLDPDGNSASQHLICDRGWPVYGVDR